MSLRKLKISLRNDSASLISFGSLSLNPGGVAIIWDTLTYENAFDNLVNVNDNISVFNQRIGSSELVMVEVSESNQTPTDLTQQQAWARFSELQKTIDIELLGRENFEVIRAPSLATDNAIARFDLTTGKLVQSSSAVIDDSGNLNLNSGTGTITCAGINGINVSTHASRHAPGGADAISTAAAVAVGTANAEGTSTSFARADHTHQVTGLTISGQAQGDILYRDASAWVRLPAGTAGQFLRTQGVGANPQWISITGDVAGPVSSTDNAIARFDLATGKLIQNSVGILDDTGNLNLNAGAGTITCGNINGVSITAHASRHNPGGADALTTAAPSATAVQIGNAAAVGTATSFARSDHVHTVTGGTPVNVTKAANAAGTATTFARSDHKHDVTTAAAVAVGTANAEGTSTSLARADHTHQVTGLSITGQAQGDVLYFNGTSWVRLPAGTSGQYLQTQGSLANPQWANSSVPTNIPYTNLLQTGPGLEIKEPSGWPNAGPANDVNVTMSYVNSTRTFTLTRINDYSFWSAGQRFTKTSTESIVWPNISGTHFFYFDTSGVLQTTQVVSTWLNVIGGNGCPIAAISWNASINSAIALFEERHGLMEGETHKWAHESIRSRWVSGGLLDGFVFGNGTLNSHATFNVSDTIIRDEDIRISAGAGDSYAQIMSPLNCRVYFKNGNFWTYKNPDAYPVLQGGAGYIGGTVPAGRLYFNQITGLVGSLVQVTNNGYVLAHIAVTGESSGYSVDGSSKNWKVFAVTGQKQYNTIDAARAGALSERLALELDTLPFQEFVWLGTVIYQTKDSFSNAVKAATVQSADTSGNLSNYVDWRISIAGGAGNGTSIGTGVEIFSLLSATGDEFMTNNTLGRLYAMAVVPPVTFTMTKLTFLISQNNAGGTGGVAIYNSAGVRLAYSSLQAFSLGVNTISLDNGGPIVLVGGDLYYFCIESNINSCAPLSIQAASVFNPPVGPNVPPLAFFVNNSRSVDATGFPVNISSYFGQVGTDARKYWMLGN